NSGIQRVAHRPRRLGDHPGADAVLAVGHAILGDVDRLAQLRRAFGRARDALWIDLADGGGRAGIAARGAGTRGASSEELAGLVDIEGDVIAVIDVDADVVA